MTAEQESIYSERYVAFVDILGFSNIVRNSVRFANSGARACASF